MGEIVRDAVWSWRVFLGFGSRPSIYLIQVHRLERCAATAAHQKWSSSTRVINVYAIFDVDFYFARSFYIEMCSLHSRLVHVHRQADSMFASAVWSSECECVCVLCRIAFDYECLLFRSRRQPHCGECFRKHNDLKLFSVSGANELVVRIILASNHFNIQNNPRLEHNDS